MSAQSDHIIASAVIRCIHKLNSDPASRLFIRLEDFSESIYRRVIESLVQKPRIDNPLLRKIMEKRYSNRGGNKLIIRSISPIPGFEDFAIEEGRSATWYRNNLNAGETLLLIFNRRTSDAQSLKDLYTINSVTLIREKLEILIEASIQNYQCNEQEKEAIIIFVDKTLRKIGFEPQLHDLVNFFTEIDRLLNEHAGVEKAIVLSLPYLHMFRCRVLAKHLNDPRGKKILRDMYQTARIGFEIVEESRQKRLLNNLEKAEFSDDVGDGALSAEEKKKLLRDFVNGELSNQPDHRRRVFQIDWEEVQQIITPRQRAPKREQVIQELQDVQQQTPSPLPDIDELIDALQCNVDPETQIVESTLQAIGEQLSSGVRAALRRLIRPRNARNADFLYGLMTLLIEMRRLYEQPSGLRVSVHFQTPDRQSKKIPLSEAARAFQRLYGGIERAMPAMQWHLDELWNIAESGATEDNDDEESRDQERKTQISFRVIIEQIDHQAHRIGEANLIWEYRADSPVAATVAALDAERTQMTEASLGPMFDAEPATARIPVYRFSQNVASIHDLDLHEPLRTIGNWYNDAENLRKILVDLCNERRFQESVIQPILKSLSDLEQSWASFIRASQQGLFNDAIRSLLDRYADFLNSALVYLSKSQYLPLYRAINQAWLIIPSFTDSWVIMPLLHPMKLYWWQQRAKIFNDLVERMFDKDARAVDYKMLQREISTACSSRHMPPALTFADKGHIGQWFVTYEETQGYELFRQQLDSLETAGFNIAELAEDEQEIAHSQAVDTLISVIQDYLETHPFVQDGLNIVLLECKHSALPIMLLEKLIQKSRKATLPQRIHITVHTSQHGATIYRRVDEWLTNEPERTEREGAAYLPPITVNVLECPLNDAISQTSPADIVFLVDFFTQYGRRLKPKLVPRQVAQQEDIVYAYQIRPEPFEEGEVYRRLRLTPTAKPEILRLFLLCQYAGSPVADNPLPKNTDDIDLYAICSLEQWQDLLQQLHEHFNWVVCYDETIDRFLLRAASQNNVQIIRYALGLGAQRLHHLTISSSGRTQDIVVQRLASRLEQILPRLTRDQCHRVAAHLADRANAISGDMVLRAAGPGEFLNELIGLVAAIFETEQTFFQQHPDSLIVWILLDDFKHWFSGGKIPDLLFVGLSATEDRPIVEIQVIEAKCVNSHAFESEARDARMQIRRGVSRLINAFRAGGAHLDAPYWYDQIYRAIAGNLQLTDRTQELWTAIGEHLYRGDFQVIASGHSRIFCHDGQAGVINGPSEKLLNEKASDAPDVPLYEHCYGVRELVAVLRTLTRQTSGIDQEGILDWDTTRAPVAVAIPSVHPNNPDQSHQPAQSSSSRPETDDEPSPDTNKRQTVSEQPEFIGETPLAPTEPVQRWDNTLPPVDTAWLQRTAHEIEQSLRVRDIRFYPIDVADADQGPSIVRFKLRLKPNQQLSKIQSQAKDLARELRLRHPPFIDNVPGTHFIGIDIPREPRATVYLQPLLTSLPNPGPAELPVIIGMSPDGEVVIEDLAEFPHLLVAGATKSGKSVFLRNLLLSLLAVYRPGQIELLIIDPKKTDFTIFDGLPYLRGGSVIVEIRAACEALLELARGEMPRRQRVIANRSMKIKTFNQRFPEEALPPIVAIVDEYHLLKSQMDKKEQEAFEQQLSILAAAARAVGIHLVVATQRPSADVITSTIKANLDARIALRVASSTNSRVILDTSGAENLLGHGDMLFRRSDGSIIRLQAPFMDEDEIRKWLDDRFGRRSYHS
ncbi:DNA translocase FtsK [Roseiflexus sp.]|uniref:DNA translocase FtsK n=1 Tax=Roseiflexus sp. TaxID=2562120 RepID=UPI00398BB5B2